MCLHNYEPKQRPSHRVLDLVPDTEWQETNSVLARHYYYFQNCYGTDPTVWNGKENQVLRFETGMPLYQVEVVVLEALGIDDSKVNSLF